jgi:hypothetical protein
LRARKGRFEINITQLLFGLHVGAKQGFATHQAEIQDSEFSPLFLHPVDADKPKHSQQNSIAYANSDGRLVQVTRLAQEAEGNRSPLKETAILIEEAVARRPFLLVASTRKCLRLALSRHADCAG